MMNPRTQYSLVFVISAVTIPPPSYAQHVDSTLKNEIASNFETQYRAYLSKLAAYQYESKSEYLDPTTKAVIQQSRVEMKQNGVCNLHSETFSPTDIVRSVDAAVALNSRYSFRLERGKGDWFIKQVKLHDRIEESIQPFCLIPEGNFVLRGMSPYVLNMHWLPEVLKEEGFEITDLVREQRGSDQFVKLGFTHRPRPGKEPLDSPHQGWILLSPDRYWIIYEYEIKYLNNGRIVHRVNEFDLESAIPLMRSISVVQKLKSGAVGSIQRISCKYEKRVVPESDFRLSAFNFPEPVGLAQESRSPLYVWLLVLAALCAMFAAAIRYWTRRRYSTAGN